MSAHQPQTAATPVPTYNPGLVDKEPGRGSVNVFLNGTAVPCVRDFELKQNYGNTEINIGLYLPSCGKLEYKEGSYYITTNVPVRLSKTQLRKLIVDNIDDNLEVVELVNEFKLSEQAVK